MKDGVIPTLNLPIKSHSSKSSTPRSTDTIAKREKCLQNAQTVNAQIPKLCYSSYYDFVQRVTKLKLQPGWTIIEKTNYLEAKFEEPESLFTAPKYEMFINKDLRLTLRCYGWAIPENAEIMQHFPTFNTVTLSEFIKMLGSYKICEGNNFFNPVHLCNYDPCRRLFIFTVK